MNFYFFYVINTSKKVIIILAAPPSPTIPCPWFQKTLPPRHTFKIGSNEKANCFGNYLRAACDTFLIYSNQ